MITTDVENYPGFPEGVTGPHMMALFRRQAERFGTVIIDQSVDRVDLSQRPFQLWSGGQEQETLTLIVATGASAKWLGIPGEQEFGGYGVSACATCDGFFFRGKEVVVVGGGDTAMEEATFLTRHAAKVTVVHRRDSLRASKIMQKRAFDNPKIEFVWNAALTEILGVTHPHKRVTGVRVASTVDDRHWELRTDGVFVAIGHQPNSQIFADWLPTDASGYLLVEPGSTRTKVPGVFVCGDVADRVYRQAVTAAGTGCMAAIDAERFLESEGY
jgi:thioredoxin reductase (NADPH)